MQHVIDHNCNFCKPEIDNSVFAERGSFRAVYNRAPVLPGHSLIIPRWHVQSLLSLSNHEVIELVLFSRIVVKNLIRIFSTQDFNWTIQEGTSAGQTVQHLHLHLIPRREGDLPSPGDWYPEVQKSEMAVIDSDERSQLSLEEIEKIVNHIKSNWAET